MTLSAPVIISARTGPRGGPARLPRVISGNLRGITRLVVFVHGFNNSEDDAKSKWRTTRRELLSEWLAAPILRTRAAEYYWPGDQGWGNRLSRAAFYAKDVAVARDCGAQLGEFLLRHEGRLRVAFVGHSLGCRLVLEALRTMYGRISATSCSTALFMAAAVPEGLCDQENRYVRVVGSPHFADDEKVLFSHRDHVLGVVFQTGQIKAELAGDVSPAPGARRAVGRHGGPFDRWDTSTRVQLGHGEYWLRAESLDHIADVFGLKRRRRLSSWRTLSRSLPGRDREDY